MSLICPQSWCLFLQLGPVKPKPLLCQDQLISKAPQKAKASGSVCIQGS